MPGLRPTVYRFDEFELDVSNRILRRSGDEIPLPAKAFDMLVELVDNSGLLLEKEELFRRVWPDQIVEESNLTVQVSAIRKALGDRSGHPKYLFTVPGHGYRFNAELLQVDEEVVIEQSSVSVVGVDRSRPRLGLAVSAVLLTASTAIVFLGVKYVWPTFATRESAPPFVEFKMTPLTTSGKAQDAVISPDGKYVAYVVTDGAQNSLWLRHISTASDVQIPGPAAAVFGNLRFSPNGDHLYYMAGGKETPVALYQVPVHGGTPRHIAPDVDSTVALSPDGKQLAFLRGYPAQQQAAVIVANADGSGERKLASHVIGDLFLNGPYALGPSWSTDGERIAYGFRNYRAGSSGASLMAVRVKDGVETQIVSGPWHAIGPISWLPDGSGLVFIAAEHGADANGQIWFVSEPGSKVHRITRDLSDYRCVSVSADSTSLVTVQHERISNLWTTSTGLDDPARISSSKYDGQTGLSWAPDGRLVYVSRASGQPEIWITNADGTDKKQMTFDGSHKSRPSVSPDGRYVVFASNRTDLAHIWRVDIGGGNEVQLSKGRENWSPHVSFDSRWVIYNSYDTATPTVWRVPIMGGEPIQLTNDESVLLAVSPQDGRMIYSYEEMDQQARPRRRAAVIPLEGGVPRKSFDFTLPWRTVEWAKDGRALTYIENRAGVSNIWSQPMDGGPARQLTNFKSDRIFQYDWAQDGTRLALARGAWSSDVVLVRDLKSERE